MPHISLRDIEKAILTSLTPDLLKPSYRAQLGPEDPPVKGHCAVASEAFYHLVGGKEAGYVPVVCAFHVTQGGKKIFELTSAAEAERKGWSQQSHWWIRGPSGGRRGAGPVFDLTAAQFPEEFPYAKGHNAGFMQPQKKPSLRAAVVIARVTEKLGARALAAFAQKQKADFQHRTHQKSHNIAIK